MDQEAADELVVASRMTFLRSPILIAVVFPSERHGVGIGADEAAVRDRDTVGVSAEIGQHRLGPAEGWFGIDHPFGFAQRGQP